jgi:hypothetical protein
VLLGATVERILLPGEKRDSTFPTLQTNRSKATERLEVGDTLARAANTRAHKGTESICQTFPQMRDNELLECLPPAFLNKEKRPEARCVRPAGAHWTATTSNLCIRNLMQPYEGFTSFPQHALPFFRSPGSRLAPLLHRSCGGPKTAHPFANNPNDCKKFIFHHLKTLTTSQYS